MTALAQTAEPPEKIPPIDETELREAEERLGADEHVRFALR